MPKPDNAENFPEKQTWGTWEELLLACAVHRYGANNWDSVAGEIRKRSAAFRSLTPVACEQKYNDLKRRFSKNDVVPDTAADHEARAEIAAIPWFDELRKLRVAELRREVERYDLSISSLQLKVKRLEEERERTSRDNEWEADRSDLDKIVEEENKETNDEPDNTPGEPVLDRPNWSVNESNSSDPKGERLGNGSDDGKPVAPETVEPDRTVGEAKLGGEDSCRGSCEDPAANSERVDQDREACDSPESFEWVAESKGEEAKENSDVQSSASLPRKEKKGVEPEEPENEDQSPANKRNPVESQPLAHFLEIVQSHKFGSLFSRRLASQETPEYTKLIQQHIDLETIRTRLEDGWYLGSNSKFFRDLLLLVNNAALFYGKESSEFKAAAQLRLLVSKEMAIKIPKQSLPAKKQSSVAPEPADSKPEPKPSHPSSLKPRMSVPLIVCRKRSSLAARSSASVSGPDQKTLKTAPLIDKKPVPDMNEAEETSDKDEKPLVLKKRIREISSSSAKKPNRSVKSRSNTNTSLSVELASKGRSSNDISESKKTDQERKANTNASSKKQSAASFLQRMKGASSSDSRSLQETVKGSVIDSSNGKRRGTEQKKNKPSNNKSDARKGQSSQKRSKGKKQANEKGSSARKSTARAPKRGAAPSSPLPAKRGRESGEKDVGSTRAKKRSRR